jgi:hypothetical protein
MSNAHCHDAPPSGPDAPSLRVVEGEAPEGAFFDQSPETTATEDEPQAIQRWPKILMPLGESTIFGSSILPTSRQTRLRSVIYTLSDVAPEAIEDLTSIPTTQPEQEAAPKPTAPIGVRAWDARQETEDFLRKRILLHGIKKSRSAFANGREVVTAIWEELERTNHPVFQAMAAIERANRMRSALNQNRPFEHRLSILSRNELGELMIDLLYSTQGRYIQEACEARLQEQRKRRTA